MRRLLLLLIIVLPAPVYAQLAIPWPRNAATNHVEFQGHLPWPDSVKSAAQQAALVRHWFRWRLTNETAAEIRRMLQDSGAAYAGLPSESHYVHGIAGPELERFTLYFHLNLVPDGTGLTYQLFDFECGYTSFDNGSSTSLEEALKLPDERVQAVIEGFHRRLLLAVKGW